MPKNENLGALAAFYCDIIDSNTAIEYIKPKLRQGDWEGIAADLDSEYWHKDDEEQYQLAELGYMDWESIRQEKPESALNLLRPYLTNTDWESVGQDLIGEGIIDFDEDEQVYFL